MNATHKHPEEQSAWLIHSAFLPFFDGRRSRDRGPEKFAAGSESDACITLQVGEGRDNSLHILNWSDNRHIGGPQSQTWYNNHLLQAHQTQEFEIIDSVLRFLK